MTDSGAFLAEIAAGALGRLARLDVETFAILGLSLKIAIVATILGFLLALPLAGLIHACRPRVRAMILIAMQTMISVPTVIVGTIVYLLLSRRGPLGGLELLYTPAAIVAGDLLLVIPLLTVFIGSALQQVPRDFVETAKNLGAKPFQLLFLLALECRGALAVAVCVGFGRVISELGAAMILGGNIKGCSRTLTTAMALEMGKGETELAMALGMLLLLLALANTLAVQYLQYRISWRGRRLVPETTPVPHAPSDCRRGAASDTRNDPDRVFPQLPPVEIRGLSVRFEERILFDNLSATLEMSGGTALMGASGSGKSTLLRIMAGLASPDAGVVDHAWKTPILTFQRPYLFDGTVRMNIEFGMRIRGVPAEERRERAERLGETLGLLPMFGQPVRNLSGGEAARVSLGRALAVRPDLLLIDEALSHLDRMTLRPVILLLRAFIGNGGALLLVTHEEWLADELCSRKIHLRRGTLEPHS
ncbi:MAG TPA: ABC transporter permease [Candidatus Ozemobacteraceae bacterium]|nr:ABC transporter permease [Candidatus Ozemobacteraceae bacterium]